MAVSGVSVVLTPSLMRLRVVTSPPKKRRVRILMEVWFMKKFLKRLFHREPKTIVIHDHDEWLRMLDKELG